MATDYEMVIPTLHVAGMPDEDGNQYCGRCGVILHKGRTGAPVPWYPTQIVAKTSYYAASIRAEPEGWPRCTAR